MKWRNSRSGCARRTSTVTAHALLIGVTRFSDPQLNGLRAPRSDVEALKTVLDDRTRGGFDEVVNSIDDDLLEIREKISALLEDRHPSDMVLLYYSGHGIVDRGNRLFLATGETRADSPRARSLAASEVREMMEQSRAGRLVVVLDCCHSGVFTEGAKGKKVAPVNDTTFDPGEGAEGVYVLTATNALQYALDSETASRDGAAVQPALSHFTSWLLDGLGRGEAAPDKPVITLDDLFTYLCRRARQSGAPMTPQRYVKRNSGEMVIARNPAAQPSSIPDSLLARLDSLDWEARLNAVVELKDMVSKRVTLRSAARKLLRDRMSSERDRDVNEAMMACLVDLDHKREPNERGRSNVGQVQREESSGEQDKSTTPKIGSKLWLSQFIDRRASEIQATSPISPRVQNVKSAVFKLVLPLVILGICNYFLVDGLTGARTGDNAMNAYNAFSNVESTMLISIRFFPTCVFVAMKIRSATKAIILSFAVCYINWMLTTYIRDQAFLGGAEGVFTQIAYELIICTCLILAVKTIIWFLVRFIPRFFNKIR